AVAEEEEEEASPEGLEVHQEEVDFIAELTPLLGRSPRALKRFANVYRLVKAGLRAYEEREFLESAGGMADYQAVLLLLAVDTGTPQVSRTFFEALSRTYAEPGLAPVIAQMATDPEIAAEDDWQRLQYWLRVKDPRRVPEDRGKLVSWAERVRRYSFNAGRV
ncbi:MAG TPA: hypothetical protein VFX98_10435, partial [Longimicrobiaceae bacterium]|nr:hypothetical protein [Longimicrobiaceae bacterium]